jgi:hypothetical protein
MTNDNHRDGLLDDALQALLSMAPDRIEAEEIRLRECLRRAGTSPAGLNAAMPALRLTRAAAVQSAVLWRGCIPQPGYNPAGPVEHVPAVVSLCVSG